MKILFILAILISTSHSQLSVYQSEYTNEYDLKFSSFPRDNSKMSLLLSLGTGRAIDPEHIMLSPAIIWEMNEHFNAAAGIDLYFPAKYHDATFSINLLPYYWLRAGVFNFRIGAGLAFWDGHILGFSSIRADFEIFRNNFVGTEVKSLLSFPFPADDGFPILPILINYSVRF